MGYSGAEIITRFATYAGQPHGREPGKRGRTRERFPDGSGSSLYYRTDGTGRVVEIQSYGSHFPLGRLVLDKHGKRKRWLLNGDRWPGGGFARTNDHNDMMRERAQESGTPTFTVPFSVVREAGITMDSIVPVHVLPERWVTEEHTATALADVPEHRHKHRVWRDSDGNEITSPRVTAHLAGAEREQEAHPDHKTPGGWYYQERSAIGDWHQVTVNGPAYSGELTYAYEEEITPGTDGLYHYATDRHWLGEAVFRATYTTYEPGHGYKDRTRYFLSAFDTAEPAPAYFLAEMPAGVRPQTVDDAREALKPAAVADAEIDGLTVVRQGDIFAIPTAYSTRDLKAGETWSTPAGNYVLGTNHTATQVIVTPAGTFARGILRHRPALRKPDHVNVPLGDRKTWFRLIRNTVPVDARGNARAWSVHDARASID
jgi:hypothetical protein